MHIMYDYRGMSKAKQFIYHKKLCVCVSPLKRVKLIMRNFVCKTILPRNNRSTHKEKPILRLIFSLLGSSVRKWSLQPWAFLTYVENLEMDNSLKWVFSSK